MSLLSLPQILAAVNKIRERSAANTSQVSLRQQRSLRDPGVRGPVWVSRVAFPAPETGEGDITSLLSDAIQILGCGHEKYTAPSVLEVKAEWTGYRPGALPHESEPNISEKEKYQCLMGDIEDSCTVLYLHGGSFILNSPASYRNITSKLSVLTRGRCLAVNYRLSPQNPFPAALLDVLIAYLALLHPPPGSYHAPIPASSIVFAGDSSGGCLALAVIQVIIAIGRARNTRHPTVRIYGHTVAILMPSGVALQSVYGDQTYALPSWLDNAGFDILQDFSPLLRPDYPSCPIWPTVPPRADPYCEASMLCHPLVSPTIASNWSDAAPMWIAMGEERLSDAAKIIAQTAATQGVVIHWEEYKGMPHNWPMIFPSWWQSRRCMEHWAQACLSFAHGRDASSSAETMSVDGQVTKGDVTNLTRLGLQEASKRMRAKQASFKPWTGDKATRGKL